MEGKIVLVVILLPFQVTLSLDDIQFLIGGALQTEWSNIIANAGESRNCREQLNLLTDAVENKDRWAVQMMDATGKPASGYYQGNVYHIGNYDECINIEHNNNNGTAITGKYCIALINPVKKSFKSLILAALNRTTISGDIPWPDYLRILWGACIPSACSTHDMQKIWNYTKNQHNFDLQLTFSESTCTVQDEPMELRTLDYLVVLFFGIVAGVIVISTMYDLIRPKGKNKNGHQLLRAFSLYTNGVSLFSFKTSAGNLKCLNGIKGISVMWIVLSHRLIMTLLTPNANGLFLLDWKFGWDSMLIQGGQLAVDTFLTISGMLVVYTYLQKTEEGVRFNIFGFYLHRLIRLVPALAAVVMIYVSWFRYMGNGPFWKVFGNAVYKDCQRSWWYILLFIQNYRKKQLCAQHAWYLAVDSQLYFLAPLVLIPLRFHPKAALLVVLGAISLLELNAFLLTWYGGLSATFFRGYDGFGDEVYYPTHIRAAPYLIGMIYGYAIFASRKGNVLSSKKLQYVMWPLSLSSLVLSCYSIYYVSVVDYDVVISSLVNSIARPLWAVGIGYIVLACSTGHGGVLNSFLSLSIFTFLNKVNYAIYLLQIPIMQAMILSVRSVPYTRRLDYYHAFFGDYFFIFVSAIIWTLMFDSPATRIYLYLQQKCFKMEKKKQKNRTANMDSTDPRNVN